MRPQDRYTYEEAGFNSFMLRSMKSNPGAQTLRGGISKGTGRPIAFDRQSIEGMIGDKLKLGRLVLNGPEGRIAVLDRMEINEVGWMGDLTQ